LYISEYIFCKSIKLSVYLMDINYFLLLCITRAVSNFIYLDINKLTFFEHRIIHTDKKYFSSKIDAKEVIKFGVNIYNTCTTHMIMFPFFNHEQLLSNYETIVKKKFKSKVDTNLSKDMQHVIKLT